MSEPLNSFSYEEFEERETVKKPDYSRAEAAPSLKALARSAFSLSSLALGLCGFFLTGAGFFEVLHPFGVAWFAAVSLYDRRRIALWFLSVFLGLLFFVPEELAVYSVILLTELLALTAYFAVGRGNRYFSAVTVFSSVTVVRGVFLLFSGISDILLVITLTESILAAGLATILCRALSVCRRCLRMEQPGRGDILCILFLAGGVLLGMDQVAVYSVSPAHIVICLLILASSWFAGAGGGAAAGAAAGVIPSLSSLVSPTVIGLYAFSGFMAGLFRKLRRPGVVFGYLLGNVLLSLYLLNMTMDVPAAAETLLGSVLFLAIPKNVLLRAAEAVRGQGDAPIRADRRSRGEEYALSRLRETEKNLSVLRDTIADLHREAEPKEEKNIGSILDHISAKVCAGCTLKNVCWETDLDETYRDLMRVFALADANDGITAKQLPQGFRRRCCHYKEMTAAVNCLYELYRKNEYWQRQVVNSRDLAMAQMDHTLLVIDGLAADMDARRAERELLRARLGAELRKRGVRVDRVLIDGLGENDVTLRMKTRHCAGNRRCEREIAEAVSKLTGRAFRAAECRCGQREKGTACLYRCVSGDALRLDVGTVQMMREGSAVCGDASGEVILGGDREALLISDGMGSGPKAKKESEWTVGAVKAVLNSGYGKDFAAGLVRYRMMMDREEELYATMDLCLVDGGRRVADFVKLGAGDSYLCTPGRGIRVIAGGGGRSAPLSPDASREEIARGDIIILASDGIGETADGMAVEEWLGPLLAETGDEGPKVIGDRILREAIAAGGGKVKDDITITVAKVV